MNVLFSRYWTENFGYKSNDFTVDTFVVIGLCELPLFMQYESTTGFTLVEMVYGVSSSICFMFGVLIFIYAASQGLSGPTTALAQIQGIVHLLLNSIIMS